MTETLPLIASVLWTCLISLGVKLLFDTRKDVRKINGSIATLLQWKEGQEKRCDREDQNVRDLWTAIDKVREKV